MGDAERAYRARTRSPRGLWPVALGALLVLAGPAAADDSERIRRLEDTVRALRDQVQELSRGRAVDRARVAEASEQVSQLSGVLSRVELGGYGSFRWENSSISSDYNGFSLRRLVMTTAADVGPRLRFYSELEYERFREIELERSTGPAFPTEGSRGIKLVQEIEGTHGSEIALEQAWLDYALGESLSARFGAMLVPLGRFNRSHDDNQWNLTRRSLIDRGAPVLPVKGAWDELGIGLVGGFDARESHFDWELYVLNGASLEATLETVAAIRVGRRDKIELELEFSPQNGSFAGDTKDAKSLSGRLAWQPPGGHELAFSFYHGRYTPDYLDDESITSLGLDGLVRAAGFEIEGQYLFTRYDGARSVAASLARVATESSSNNPSVDDPILETEIEVAIKGLADAKHGYWLEIRRPFWRDWLSPLLFGGDFADPRIVPVLRWEQVFFQDRVTDLAFTGGLLTDFETENRVLNRLTAGLAFRPVPLVGFTLAYEYLFANGDSLDGLTNYLPDGIDEEHAHTLSFGATFGF